MGANAAGETWRGEFDQAVELAVAGDLDASLAILARLEQQHPDEPEILRRSAQVLARSGNTSKAAERFQRLKQLSPDTFTDREQLLVLLLSEGAAGKYAAERRELLAAFEAAGDRELTRSPNFIRELFVVDKTVNVDAYEFYPNSRSGPLTPYYLFVLTDSDGVLKGHFLVAENSEKTAKLKEQGKISESGGGYYLEFRRASETSDGSKANLITLFPGARAPTYEQAREAVVTYISERQKS
jgi:tetratricopeptide (TPR) repeat protein